MIRGVFSLRVSDENEDIRFYLISGDAKKKRLSFQALLTLAVHPKLLIVSGIQPLDA